VPRQFDVTQGLGYRPQLYIRTDISHAVPVLMLNCSVFLSVFEYGSELSGSPQRAWVLIGDLSYSNSFLARSSTSLPPRLVVSSPYSIRYWMERDTGDIAGDESNSLVVTVNLRRHPVKVECPVFKLLDPDWLPPMDGKRFHDDPSAWLQLCLQLRLEGCRCGGE
jgi:hypothetical protein